MQGPYLVQMGNTHNACINGHRRRRLFLSLLLLADSTRAKLGFDSIVTKENHKEEAEGGTLTKHSITPKPHKLYTSRWRGGGDASATSGDGGEGERPTNITAPFLMSPQSALSQTNQGKNRQAKRQKYQHKLRKKRRNRNDPDLLKTDTKMGNLQFKRCRR